MASEGGGALRLTFYDSFDWRLHRAGLSLRLEQPSRRPAKLCCARQGTGEEDCQDVAAVPRFADDLPAGRLRTRLQQVGGIRALLPLVTLRGWRYRYAVRNEDGKMVARCFLEQWRPASRRYAGSAPVGLVRLEPLRGYEADTAAVAELLRGEELERTGIDLLQTALELVGRVADDYSSKLDVKLQPEEDAVVAVRRLLRSQVDVMRANEAGIRHDLDSEFLHDFRVAVRRTRSALSQIKGIFAEPALAPFRDGFAWLGAVTGPKRDLDVHLLQFPEQQRLLAPGQSADLLPLRLLLEQQQAAAGAEVVAALKSARYRRLMRYWQTFLDQGGTEFDGANARQPAAGVANSRIWRVYRRVRREGRAISADSPPADLHELRKSCKKLRYLMEFFQSLYPRNKMRRAISHLKDLQENLGQYQDQTVQLANLRRHSEELAARGGEIPVPTLLAIGALMDRIAGAHQQTRAGFARRFAAFYTPANHRLFRELFHTRGPSMADQP
jgi:CHAD domain-containing protein